MPCKSNKKPKVDKPVAPAPKPLPKPKKPELPKR